MKFLKDQKDDSDNKRLHGFGYQGREASHSIKNRDATMHEFEQVEEEYKKDFLWDTWLSLCKSIKGQNIWEQRVKLLHEFPDKDYALSVMLSRPDWELEKMHETGLLTEKEKEAFAERIKPPARTAKWFNFNKFSFR